jgi:adenylate cyclase
MSRRGSLRAAQGSLPRLSIAGDNAAMTDVRSVIDWLVDGARSASTPQDVLAEMGARLVAAGIPLRRVNVFVRTLHPDLMGRRLRWEPGKAVDINETPIEVLSSEMFRTSPVLAISKTGRSLRRRLLAPDCPFDFPVLDELKAQGATDYLITPLPFIGGETHAISWTTRAPVGFSEAEIAALEAVAVPLARVAEIWALRRVATNLLDTYVGRQAGARILAGQIRRGDSESIAAAIWLSDLRGFTDLADRTPGPALLELLNRYFDCQVPAILAQGGEVLKYMGDGLLAIFPIAGNASAVCRAALAAARAFRAAVATLNADSGDDPAARLRFGLALHVGEVLYGNIGGGNRLDFTAIGPAVNLAARLESLARDLNRAIIASGAFAQACPQAFVPLGERQLRGVAAPQPAFGLADDA